MTELVWAYLVVRYWRGIAWTFAWMFAFWAPVLIPIPLVGWCAPPLLYWAAVSSRRRRLDRQERTPLCEGLTRPGKAVRGDGGLGRHLTPRGCAVTVAEAASLTSRPQRTCRHGERRPFRTW